MGTRYPTNISFKIINEGTCVYESKCGSTCECVYMCVYSRGLVHVFIKQNLLLFLVLLNNKKYFYQIFKTC